MKSINYIITICLIAFSLSVFADKKMTLRNSDTGESFEVMVPDGLRIYEYNSNWRDSIPYLMERARHGEPWAHEALGDCYRFGKGGLKRSFMNAIFSYLLAGKNIDELIANIRQNNNDPMAVFLRLIDYVENMDYDRIVCAIDTLNESEYHSADILRKYVSRRKDGLKRTEMIEYIANPETDADACFFAAAGCRMCEPRDTVKIDISWSIQLLFDKIPYLYSEIGVNKYEETLMEETSDCYAVNGLGQHSSKRRKAVEYLLKADEHAFLSKKAAEYLYHYCTRDSSSDWVTLTDADLYRIGAIAGNVR